MSRNMFKTGSEVRVGHQNSIPVRYQGRLGILVGTQQNNRGTQQFLVSFPGRRATPLVVNSRQISAL